MSSDGSTTSEELAMGRDKIQIKEASYREMRARGLASSIMHVLDDHISRASRNEVYDRLIDLFYDADAEIITETDRVRAGLPLRNALGLTPEEHKVIEAKRMQILTAPPAPMFFCINCPNKPASDGADQ